MFHFLATDGEYIPIHSSLAHNSYIGYMIHLLYSAAIIHRGKAAESRRTGGEAFLQRSRRKNYYDGGSCSYRVKPLNSNYNINIWLHICDIHRVYLVNHNAMQRPPHTLPIPLSLPTDDSLTIAQFFSFPNGPHYTIITSARELHPP